jgi:hypothetical protein
MNNFLRISGKIFIKIKVLLIVMEIDEVENISRSLILEDHIMI